MKLTRKQFSMVMAAINLHHHALQADGKDCAPAHDALDDINSNLDAALENSIRTTGNPNPEALEFNFSAATTSTLLEAFNNVERTAAADTMIPGDLKQEVLTNLRAVRKLFAASLN